MKFYIHKETGEPMASLHELLDPTTGDNVNGYPSQIEREGGCYTRVIFPNKWLGDGIVFHIMHYKNFSKFKRISKEKFFELCPDFGQLRHWGDETIDRKKHRKLFSGGDYDISKRKMTFGVGNPNENNWEKFLKDKGLTEKN